MCHASSGCGATNARWDEGVAWGGSFAAETFFFLKHKISSLVVTNLILPHLSGCGSSKTSSSPLPEDPAALKARLQLALVERDHARQRVLAVLNSRCGWWLLNHLLPHMKDGSTSPARIDHFSISHSTRAK